MSLPRRGDLILAVTIIRSALDDFAHVVRATIRLPYFHNTGSYVVEEVQYKHAKVFAILQLKRAPNKVIMYSYTCFNSTLERTLIMHFFCYMRDELRLMYRVRFCSVSSQLQDGKDLRTSSWKNNTHTTFYAPPQRLRCAACKVSARRPVWVTPSMLYVLDKSRQCPKYRIQFFLLTILVLVAYLFCKHVSLSTPFGQGESYHHLSNNPHITSAPS
jgi:hypothetical protein